MAIGRKALAHFSYTFILWQLKDHAGGKKSQVENPHSGPRKKADKENPQVQDAQSFLGPPVKVLHPGRN